MDQAVGRWPGSDERARGRNLPALPLNGGKGPAATEALRNGSLDFTRVYGTFFSHVARWIRALGGPMADIEDIAQEVFLVVRRRLPEFDGENLVGWLYKITRYTVRDHRRRAWFRHVLSGRRDIDLDDMPHSQDGPAAQLDRKEAQRVLHEMLSRMSDKRRTAFVLFEIEGYSGEEIALMEDIPVSTVWTRLYHARRDFLGLVNKHQTREKIGP
ncbi:MAG TPA: RNA polymerase sigma factor [Polyangiaceae bacterium]